MRQLNSYKIFRAFAILVMLSFVANTSVGLGSKEPSGKKLNVIIFTADDLGPDGVSLESFGGKMKGLTPNLDKIATAGIRFTNAHVNTSVCMPSRSIIATGMYGFHSGAHGFIYAREEVPTMMEAFQEAGYKTGVLGKVSHSSAKMSTVWDYVYDYKDLGAGRSPLKYYERTKAFISKCKSEDKPFYLMINSHDPHRPFQNSDELKAGAEWPSKMYSPDEAFVPGFLPDIPQVRKEMSEYYNSTRRLDDTFGKVMKAIEEAGALENTIIFFLSDNGIAMPFSKANCYIKATRTSFFVYRVGVYKPNIISDHYISTIDIFPTIMELTGLNAPEKVDGRSFVPLLNGKSQKNRKLVFTQIDYINQKKPLPMRCIQDKNYGYLFNAWSDGANIYKNANEGQVVKAMEAMTDNPEIQERILMHRYRVVEEFYDLKNDPDCLENLANNKKYKSKLLKYREKLRLKMIETNDPLLETFNSVEDKEKMKSTYLELYTNVLKFRGGDAKAYGKKIKALQENNFE